MTLSQKILGIGSLIAAFLLGTGVGMVLAQQPAFNPPPPPLPATPPLPLYTAPDYHDVLDGKAPLRVLVLARQKMLAWKSDGEVRILDLAGGGVLRTAAKGEMTGLARATDDGSCALRKDGQNIAQVPGAIRVESTAPINIWTPAPDRWTAFPGPLVITPTADGSFSVARELLLDDYLRNVLPAEMPATFHPQALRAQAIIARTYTLAKLGRHRDDGADLCANEHCQMFGTDDKRTKEADAALEATRGMVLLYNGKLAEPYYHSTCGGVTDDAGIVWGPEYAHSYLAGGPDAPRDPEKPLSIEQLLQTRDAYCRFSNASRWIKTFTAAEVDTLVSTNLTRVTNDPTAQIRHVTKMAIEERTPNGRVAALRVEGDGASIVVFGDKIRWLFGNGAPGPNGLFSTLFQLTTQQNTAGEVTGYTFTGAGRGHGLGMCQWGADGRARAGQSCRDILLAYFPGTQVSDGKK